MSFEGGLVRGGLQVVTCKPETTFKSQPVIAIGSEGFGADSNLAIAVGRVTGTLAYAPGIKPGSFYAESNTGKIVGDDGKGAITGDTNGANPRTINYITGVVDFTFEDDGASTSVAVITYENIGSELATTNDTSLTPVLGVVDGVAANDKIKPGSFSALSNTAKEATDNGDGTIGGDVQAGGTINYATGAVNFEFDDAGASTSCTMSYSYFSQIDYLYMAGRASANETSNEIKSPLIRGELTESDASIVDFEGDCSLPLYVQMGAESESDLIGAAKSLLEGFFGTRRVIAADTVDAGAWTTSVFGCNVTGREVGDAIAVKLSAKVGTNKVEIAQITAIDTGNSEVTISPSFSAIPVENDVVLRSTLYSLSDPVTDPDTLWFNIYRGRNFLVEAGGQMVKQLSFGFPTSNLVTLEVQTQGAAGPDDFDRSEVTQPIDGNTQDVTGKLPLIASGMQVVKDGVRLTGCRVITASADLANAVQSDKALEASRTVCRVLRGMYSLSGKIDMFAQDIEDLTKFRDEERGSLILGAGNFVGTDTTNVIMALLFGRVRYSPVTDEEEGVEEKFSATWTAEEPIFGNVRYPRKTAVLAFF